VLVGKTGTDAISSAAAEPSTAFKLDWIIMSLPLWAAVAGSRQMPRCGQEYSGIAGGIHAYRPMNYNDGLPPFVMARPDRATQ
jgi:hypothetical protein